MQEWIYKERNTVKTYTFSVVIVMEVFLIAAACLTIYAQIIGSIYLGFLYILIISLSVLIWPILGMYAISNVASVLVLSADSLKIQWSKNRITVYPWDKIKLHKIGLNKIPLIVAYDDKWGLLKKSLPRWVLIDGSSRQYKEMINKIENIKNDIQI
jgi:hypothetical protein